MKFSEKWTKRLRVEIEQNKITRCREPMKRSILLPCATIKKCSGKNRNSKELFSSRKMKKTVNVGEEFQRVLKFFRLKSFTLQSRVISRESYANFSWRRNRFSLEIARRSQMTSSSKHTEKSENSRLSFLAIRFVLIGSREDGVKDTLNLRFLLDGAHKWVICWDSFLRKT